jgi:protein-arginine deiminase
MPIVDIRADTNRDGKVDLSDPTEDKDEETWDATHGAVFLANLDDDDLSCPKVSNNITDVALAACHDAADEALDGKDDLKDLAPLKTAPWPDAPDDAVGTLTLALPGAKYDARNYARLFLRDGDKVSVYKQGDKLEAKALRSGIELALEGKQIVRDKGVWDGLLDVTLELTYTEAGSKKTVKDTVRLRVSPVMTSHHLQAMDTLYVSDTAEADSVDFRTDLKKAASAAATPHVIELPEWDQWTQDFFETGWMAMPAAGGTQQVIKVFIRSANVDKPKNPSTPLRPAGRVVFQARGPDVAAVQQFDLTHNPYMDTLNSLGNLETVPPYTHDGKSYPLGRIMMGKTAGFYPAPSFTKMLEAQQVQPPIWIDTSWLLVGHVDETISFVKASTPRGWKLVLNDATLAKKMLQDASTAGNGATKMFVGKQWYDGWKLVNAEKTIDQVLADTEVMGSSAKAVIEVNAQLAQLKQETGITDAEIIRVPFLHTEMDGASAAYQPGTANSTYLDGHFAAPDPHGPVIGGVDIFKKELSDTFAKHGITVHFVENWNLYHRLGGEVHCGTNALRKVPTDVKWWESGR